MKRTDLAYIAGIFDGEGCIQIVKRTDRNGQHSLRASLEMANEFIPNLLQFYFGGSVHKRDFRSRGWQIQWHWVVSSNKAKLFIEAILPYLKLKRNEAELGLKFQSSMHTVGERLTDGEIAVREAQRILMSKMKIKQ